MLTGISTDYLVSQLRSLALHNGSRLILRRFSYPNASASRPVGIPRVVSANGSGAFWESTIRFTDESVVNAEILIWATG